MCNVMDCNNCIHSSNEPSEGVCANCYRSTGIEDEWEPMEETLGLDPTYILDDGCVDYNYEED
jgi:hypothetical protein